MKSSDFLSSILRFTIFSTNQVCGLARLKSCSWYSKPPLQLNTVICIIKSYKRALTNYFRSLKMFWPLETLLINSSAANHWWPYKYTRAYYDSTYISHHNAIPARTCERPGVRDGLLTFSIKNLFFICLGGFLSRLPESPVFLIVALCTL